MVNGSGGALLVPAVPLVVRLTRPLQLPPSVCWSYPAIAGGRGCRQSKSVATWDGHRLATTVYLSAALITAATDACVGALRPYARYDWHGTKAADLEWSCWDTALHVADDLYFYAVQLIYGPPDRDHLPTELALEDAATVTRVLDAIPAHGELLRRTVLSAGRDDRAYHV